MTEFSVDPIPVPPPAAPQLAAIAKLNPASLDLVRGTLNSDLAEYSVQQLERTMASVADDSGIDPQLAAEALLGLASARDWRGLTSIAAVEALSTDSFQLTADEQGELSSILDTRAIRVLARSLDLYTEHQRLFMGVRVITDLRPIFDYPEVELSTGPIGTLIEHDLRITYQEDGRPKSIHLALDTSDLRKLRDAIDRADEKTAALSTAAAEADISIVTLESGSQES